MRRGDKRGEEKRVRREEARRGEPKRSEARRGEERRGGEKGNLPPPSHCSFLDVIVPSASDSSLFCWIKLVFCLATSGKSTCGSVD